MFEGHDSPVNACALDEEQRLLFTASNDGTARAWDAKRGKELLSFTGHEDSVMTVQASHGVLYTASSDTTVRAWDANTGDQMIVFRGHESSVRSLTVAEGVLYSCSWDNNAVAWDARSGQELARYHVRRPVTAALVRECIFEG
jgi:WD40 repeat protein